MSKSKKRIKLFTDSGFEESAIELLQSFEPGPVYILSTDTPQGPGIFLCDEPFTAEEAEEQHQLVPDDVLINLVDDDVVGSDKLDDFPVEEVIEVDS